MTAKISESKTREIVQALKSGKAIDDVATDCEVGKTTVYRVRAGFAGKLLDDVPRIRQAILRKRRLDKRLNVNNH